MSIWRRRGRRPGRAACRPRSRRSAPGRLPSMRARSSVVDSCTLADVDRPAVDLDAPGLQPRDVEQVVDEVDEAVGRDAARCRGTRAGASSRPSPARSSSTKPLIEVSGQRSSCEAVATNSLLRRSRRARSVASRIVQTTPPAGEASSRAAVTASVRPSWSSSTSTPSASSTVGRQAADVGEVADRDLRQQLAGRAGWRSRPALVVDDEQAVAEAARRDGEAPALGLQRARRRPRGRRPWR